MPRQPAFDDFARQRVWEKLTYLMSRYPSLTWSSIADDISDQRGIKFDRKNFERLRKGSLGDTALRIIITWISDQYDPSFGSDLERSDAFSENMIGISRLTSYAPKWYPLPIKDIERITGFLSKDEFFFDLRLARWSYTGLGFMSECTAIIADFDISSHSFDKIRFCFILRNEEFIYISGSAYGLSRISDSVSLHNVIAFTVFYFSEVIQKTTTIVVFSADSIYDYLSIMFGASINIRGYKIFDMFEPPLATKSDEDFAYYVRIDCIRSHGYVRLLIRISYDLKIHIIQEKFICSINHTDPSLTEAHANISYLPHEVLYLNDSIPEDVLSVLNSTSEGRKVIRLILYKRVSLVRLTSADTCYFYNYDNMNVIYCKSMNYAIHPALEAAYLVEALYHAAIHIADIPHPPMEQQAEFFSAYYGRELDVLISVCTFLSEIKDEDSYRAAYTFLAYIDLEKFFEAFKAGMDREDLYKIYAAFIDKGLEYHRGFRVLHSK